MIALLGLAPDARALPAPPLSLAVDSADAKPALGAAERKVDARLRAQASPAAVARGRLVSALVAPAEAAWRRPGQLRVTLTLTEPPSAHIQALLAAGLQIEIANDRVRTVEGWVAADRVLRLADLAVVRSVRPAVAGETRIGAATSEGDAAARADLARQLGWDGNGVVVGVISDGIDGVAASQASGDLPAVVVPDDPRCRRGAGNEGTAMLEIVHDVAPGAALLFASGIASATTMVEAIECLTAAGADVIVDDLGFSEEPYFEDGAIAQAAAASVAAGVSYHSATGNDHGKYYVAEFRDAGDKLHDFGAGDATNTVTLPPSRQLRCHLQWNDPFDASGNDYDLFVLDDTDAVVAQSIDTQDGFGDPLETVTLFNAGTSPATLGIAIRLYDGNPKTLKLLCGQNDPDLEYASAGFGIYGHPAVPEVVAVGAISVLAPGLNAVNAFSSRGPAPIFFPAFALRPKPDLAAFDFVTTTAPGFLQFPGTSAAAPHSAAVAALLLDKNAHLTPADVRAVLASTAVDIETAGFDHAAGAGRLDALAAITAVSEPTTSTTTSTSTTTTSTSSTSTTSSSSTSTTTTTFTTTTTPTAPPSSTSSTTTSQPAPSPSMPTSTTLSAPTTTLPACDPEACAGDRRTVVRTVSRPLTRAARLVTQAEAAPTAARRRRKLSQAQRAARRASRMLQRRRPALSLACAAALEVATAATSGRSSCVGGR